MYLVEPHDRNRKWRLRFRNHDGRVVKVAGESDRAGTERLGVRIDMLIRARQNGDPPPAELQKWINNMQAGRAEWLIALGLLDQSRVERSKSMSTTFSILAS